MRIDKLILLLSSFIVYGCSEPNTIICESLPDILDAQESFQITNPIFVYNCMDRSLSVSPRVNMDSTYYMLSSESKRKILDFALLHSTIVAEDDSTISFTLTRRGRDARVYSSYKWIVPDWPRTSNEYCEFDDYEFSTDRYFEKIYDIYVPDSEVYLTSLMAERAVRSDLYQHLEHMGLQPLSQPMLSSRSESLKLCWYYFLSLFDKKKAKKRYAMQMEEALLYQDKHSNSFYVVSSKLVHRCMNYPLFKTGYNCTGIPVADTSFLPRQVTLADSCSDWSLYTIDYPTVIEVPISVQCDQIGWRLIGGESSDNTNLFPQTDVQEMNDVLERHLFLGIHQ